MKTGKIVIAGGTGFIGKYLEEKFLEKGYEVLIISRQQHHIRWNDFSKLIETLENATMLINLAGKSVDCRYSEKNKKEILLSRTETTKMLGEAMLKCTAPPLLWINSSTATIYRHAEDRPMTEADGEIGSGFSVSVATSWEKTFFDFKLPATRQVSFRMAIVLGHNAGVMKPLTNLVRFGLGGKQGKGSQMFSWIHIEDLFRIALFIQSNKTLTGVFNCAAPNSVNNSTLMHTLRKTMHQKIGLPAPQWLLKIGAFIIKTETELVLKSRWVIPEKLIKAGYDFKYAQIGLAMNDLIK
ncbi:TIGR01777 family oxidoreductase [soil metagenome]